MKRPPQFAVIVGSGFAGSLLGWIFARQGRDTVVIDRGKHPRFAIGESSTPTADFLLAYLSQRWGLPELAPLAAFGTWQTAYPGLRCGLKRGFSYFGHRHGEPYHETPQHHHSLLVAASASDAWSDTHWYRADVDAFLAQHAVQSGAELLEQTAIRHAEWNPARQRWSIELETEDCRTERVEASWLIDASGSGQGTAAWCGHRADDDWMRTRSGAVYGHFEGVESFSEWWRSHFGDGPEIFDSDDAAQHHIADRGWYWMLRFQNGITSVGWVDATPSQSELASSLSPGERWSRGLGRTPTVAELMKRAKLVDPRNALGEPQMRHVARMSRCRSHACGPGWIALPVAYGFVDPLHSFGIAHALSGIVRVAEALLGGLQDQRRILGDYSEQLRSEIDWFDTLISGSYRGLPSDLRFMAFAALYFVAAIEQEGQMAIDPAHWPYGFMNARLPALRQAAEGVWRMAGDLVGVSDAEFTDSVRQAIQPWNRVGLLDPALRNRLNHTAPPKRLAMELARGLRVPNQG
jgi:FADH2 O2-dependent halogenase